MRFCCLFLSAISSSERFAKDIGFVICAPLMHATAAGDGLESSEKEADEDGEKEAVGEET